MGTPNDLRNRHSSGYVLGDYDPENFSYNTKLSNSELLTLLIRNPKMQKAIVWVCNEVIRNRFKFKVDKGVNSLKFKREYLFKNYIEWFSWIGFFDEILKVLIWSCLLGDAIMVFYDGTESVNTTKYGETDKMLLTHEEGNSYTSCKAFYEYTEGNGYDIEDTDDFYNEPTVYKIRLSSDKKDKNIEYYVDAKRVVHFQSLQLILGNKGTPIISSIAKDCQAQESIKRAIVSSMNLFSSGILALKAANEQEVSDIQQQIGNAFSHLYRVFYKNPEDADKLFKLIIPDFKINQIKEMNDILNQEISTGSFISESVMVGAAQGIKASAENDTNVTYTRPKSLQSHFKRKFEECFYLLGKEDTDFEWNESDPYNEETGTEGKTKQTDTDDTDKNKNISENNGKENKTKTE